MVTFEDAVKIVLEKEGVLSDNRFDDGGLTKFGISRKAYPDLNISSLTREKAIELYKRDYWDEMRVSEMPPLLRLMMFDAAVNHGTFLATKILQTAIFVKVDGHMGPETLSAASSKDVLQTLQRIIEGRTAIYMGHKDFPVFGRGWLARLSSIGLLSMKEKVA